MRAATAALIVILGLCAAIVGCARAGDPVADLQAQVRRAPDSVEARVALGDAYMAAGMHHNAYIQYNQARELDPRSYEALYGVARAHEALGNVPGGLETVERALKARPDSVDALILRARLHVRSKKPDQAAADFRRALELEPDNEEALIGLPDAYIRAEELGAAEAAARKAVERLPQSPEAVLTLGLVLGVRGASQEAERVLRRAMELAPDDARPPFRLAELLVTEGRNLQEAVELADRSAEIDAAEGMPAALAAVALRKLGRDADALERLHTAALNYPRNTRLWLMMAAIYRDQGNERAAAEATSYALRFAPRRPTGQEADDAGPTPSE